MTPPEHLYAVIPAGGAGSRLWPRSRRSSPKHVLPLSGSGMPLVREAYERARPLVERVFLLTEEAQVPLLRELIPGLGPEDMIVEPAAGGTTNALGLAALTLLERDPEAAMISTAADHVIGGLAGFQAAVRGAAAVAQASDQLVAIGLTPRYAATGCGDIEAGEEVSIGGAGARRVVRFVEKPDQATAEAYVASGRHFWNLNMFCWRCTVFLEELRRYGPQHEAGLRETVAARRHGDAAAADTAYGRLPVEAVDYTVMERTDRLLVVPASFDWIDVGSWSELADLLSQDENGNVVDGTSILIDTGDSFISVPDKLVAVIGMRDLVVVDTDDALLICPKSRAQDVRAVVEMLRRAGKTEYL